jgi:hypothetical protein
MTLGHVDETLDEVIVIAMTTYLYSYVNKTPSRIKEWNRIVKRKLKESEEGLVSLTFEERVQRPAEK